MRPIVVGASVTRAIGLSNLCDTRERLTGQHERTHQLTCGLRVPIRMQARIPDCAGLRIDVEGTLQFEGRQSALPHCHSAQPTCGIVFGN